MTVADKLKRIAENEQKVYEAGHDAGYTEGINKGGYADGFEEGKKEEYDAFWDAYQQNGKRTQYNGAFYGYGWNDDNFKPKYDIAPVGYGCSSTFFQCRVTDLAAALDRQGVKLDFSKVQSLSSAFQASSITKIPPLDLSSALTCSNLVFGAYELKSITLNNIKETCVFTKAFDNGVTKLTDVTLSGTVGQDIGFPGCVSLSADSIINIIEHLSLTATGKTLTLSKAAVDKAFEESEGANNGSQTQDWEHWIGTKQTWDILLA